MSRLTAAMTFRSNSEYRGPRQPMRVAVASTVSEKGLSAAAGPSARRSMLSDFTGHSPANETPQDPAGSLARQRSRD